MLRNLDLYMCILFLVVCLDCCLLLILKVKYKYFKSNLFFYSCLIILFGGVDEVMKFFLILMYFLCYI